MIGIGEPASLSETTGALHAFNIPLVSVAPGDTVINLFAVIFYE
jgi:hypothetical protein